MNGRERVSDAFWFVVLVLSIAAFPIYLLERVSR